MEKIRNALKSLLSSGIHTVVFTKSDGTERTMQCTRDPELLSEILSEGLQPGVKKDGTPKAEPVTSVRAVDVTINEWRAFTIKNIISVNGKPFNQYLVENDLELLND